MSNRFLTQVARNETNGTPQLRMTLKEFMQKMSEFSKFGEGLYNSKKMGKLAEELEELANHAEAFALKETDNESEAFDNVTIKRNMGELKKYVNEFKKIASECDRLNQRSTALYEDMGRVLGRYYEIKDMNEYVDTYGSDTIPADEQEKQVKNQPMNEVKYDCQCHDLPGCTCGDDCNCEKGTCDCGYEVTEGGKGSGRKTNAFMKTRAKQQRQGVIPKNESLNEGKYFDEMKDVGESILVLMGTIVAGAINIVMWLVGAGVGIAAMIPMIIFGGIANLKEIHDDKILRKKFEEKINRNRTLINGISEKLKSDAQLNSLIQDWKNAKPNDKLVIRKKINNYVKGKESTFEGQKLRQLVDSILEIKRFYESVSKVNESIFRLQRNLRKIHLREQTYLRNKARMIPGERQAMFMKIKNDKKLVEQITIEFGEKLMKKVEDEVPYGDLTKLTTKKFNMNDDCEGFYLEMKENGFELVGKIWEERPPRGPNMFIEFYVPKNQYNDANTMANRIAPNYQK